MLVTEFATADATGRDAIERFETFISQWHMPTCFDSDKAEEFWATVRLLDLGEVRLSSIRMSHLNFQRTPRLIRQADPEAYEICFLLQAEGTLSHLGRDTGLRSGHLVLIDSSFPHEGWITTSLPGMCSIVVHIPRTLLPLPEAAVRRIAASSLPLSDGLGHALLRWVDETSKHAKEFSCTDAPVLTSVTVELITAVFGRLIAFGDGKNHPEAHRHALKMEVHEFIGRHLRDRSLSPVCIATAHHISVRRLYHLFAEDGTTPAAYIRGLRLAKCRRDLGDPRLAHRPAYAIAASWGLTSARHFSRAFRAAYDLSPSDYRHTALRHLVQESTRAVHGQPGTYAVAAAILGPGSQLLETVHLKEGP